jgi:hypothetical protein
MEGQRHIAFLKHSVHLACLLACPFFFLSCFIAVIVVRRELVDRTGWMVIGHNRYWSANTDYAIQNGGKFQFSDTSKGYCKKNGKTVDDFAWHGNWIQRRIFFPLLFSILNGAYDGCSVLCSRSYVVPLELSFWQYLLSTSKVPIIKINK